MAAVLLFLSSSHGFGRIELAVCACGVCIAAKRTEIRSGNRRLRINEIDYCGAVPI